MKGASKVGGKRAKGREGKIRKKGTLWRKAAGK